MRIRRNARGCQQLKRPLANARGSRSRRYPATALLIDQNERTLQLKRQDDRFRFTGVKLLTKFGKLCAILGGDDAHPVGLYVNPMATEFRSHPRWQYNFAKKTSQQFQATNYR